MGMRCPRVDMGLSTLTMVVLSGGIYFFAQATSDSSAYQRHWDEIKNAGSLINPHIQNVSRKRLLKSTTKLTDPSTPYPLAIPGLENLFVKSDNNVKDGKNMMGGKGNDKGIGKEKSGMMMMMMMMTMAPATGTPFPSKAPTPASIPVPVPTPPVPVPTPPVPVPTPPVPVPTPPVPVPIAPVPVPIAPVPVPTIPAPVPTVTVPVPTNPAPAPAVVPTPVTAPNPTRASVTVSDYYIGYIVPGATALPAQSSLDILLNKTYNYFDSILAFIYADDLSLTYLGTELTIAQALYGNNRPNASYNIYVDYSQNVFFTPESQLPTSSDIYNRLATNLNNFDTYRAQYVVTVPGFETCTAVAIALV